MGNFLTVSEQVNFLCILCAFVRDTFFSQRHKGTHEVFFLLPSAVCRLLVAAMPRWVLCGSKKLTAKCVKYNFTPFTLPQSANKFASLCLIGRLPTAGRQRAVLHTWGTNHVISRVSRCQSAIADTTARRSVAYLSAPTRKLVSGLYTTPAKMADLIFLQNRVNYR